MGVLSHPANTRRRAAVRATWGITAARLSVLLRFVVGRDSSAPAPGPTRGNEGRSGTDASAGASASSTASSTASDLTEADMLWLPLDESSSVLQKLLMWVAEAVQRWDPVYVGRADDDAYVRLELVLPDLHLLLARSLTHSAYGTVEWFAVERPSGRVSAWGRNIVQASSSWRWQQDRARKVGSAPGGDTSTRLGRPLPFLKGPLAIYSSSLAHWLVREAHAHGQVDGAVQPKPTHWRGNGRVMEDVSVGLLMASRSRRVHSNTSGCSAMGNLSTSCDEGGGVTQSSSDVGDVALVDIGLASAHKQSLRQPGGFIELRPGHNLSNDYAACFKGVHIGSRMVEHRAAHGDRCRALQGGCSAEDEFLSCMRELHAYSEKGVGPSDGQMFCDACQPMWEKQSRGLVVHHAGWKYCYFQRVAFCTRSSPTRSTLGQLLG